MTTAHRSTASTTASTANTKTRSIVQLTKYGKKDEREKQVHKLQERDPHPATDCSNKVHWYANPLRAGWKKERGIQ
jgi:hypothetical protein